MENSKSKGSLITGILIGVLLVISLVSTGYIVYDKFIKEEEVIENNNGNNNDSNTNEEEIVVDYVNIKKQVKYVGRCLVDAKTIEIDVKLPMLNIKSANADKLNKMIQNDFNDIVLEANKDETTIAILNAYYDYVIKEDVVYFFVDGANFIGCASGASRDKNYFYDIKNDKILNMEEAFKKAGYTLDDLKATAKASGYESFEKLTFEECENISCGECGFRIEGSHLTPYFEPWCL